MISNRIKILLVILVLIIILGIFYKYSNKIENMMIQPRKILWNRNKCPYILGKTIENIFDKYHIKKADNGWNLYLPCNYDNPKKEIDQMPIVKNAMYFIIDNCDKFVAKNLLWKNVVQYYGLEKAKLLLPPSYNLFDEQDLTRFKNDYNKNKLYIMKKNIQRQEGLKITNDKDEILNGKKNKYVIVQELLQNSYTIDNRKIDMRFYVLIICKNKKLNVYVHKEGFLYYTKLPFANGSLDKDVNVTTGYIDRKVYEKNPLTHGDLRKYLDDRERKLSEAEKNIRNKGLYISQIFFEHIYYLIKDVFSAFIGHIGTSDKFQNNVCFQLFGADVAINDQLQPKILEINKGPDINGKDDRDSKIKHSVIRDILHLVGAINESSVYNNNGFIKVLDGIECIKS